MRELENVLSRVTLKAASTVLRGEPIIIRLDNLGHDFIETKTPMINEAIPHPPIGKMSELNLQDATREFQRKFIAQSLETNNNNWSATARALGMHRSNFHHLAKRLGF